MAGYVTKEQMESEVPGVYDLIAPQFRDRIPEEVVCIPQNIEVIRKGFGFVQGFCDQLFARLHQKDGDPFPMWKLMAAHYTLEHELGAKTVRQVGTQIFSTMPWPKEVHNVAEAFRFMDQAYRHSQGGAPEDRVGGWPVELDEPGRLIVSNTTPYPFWMEDGTATGVCRAFSRQFTRIRLLDDGKSKRDGGLAARYEITYQRS